MGWREGPGVMGAAQRAAALEIIVIGQKSRYSAIDNQHHKH